MAHPNSQRQAKLLFKKATKLRGVSSVAMEFAVQNEMITQDEYAACLRGDMTVNASRLMNLNARSHIPTGCAVKLYHGRALKLHADAWLGQEIEERYFTQ